MEKTKSKDPSGSKEALGLYQQKPIGNTESGMASGNDSGNQNPVSKTTSLPGGFKAKG